MIAAMVAKFKVWAVAAALIVGAVLTAFLKGRSSGKEEVQKEVQEQHTKDVESVAQERVDNIKVKNDVQNKAISSPDSVIDDELSNRWTRD